MRNQLRGRGRKISPKKALIYSILTKIFANRDFISQMPVDDQEWVVDNSYDSVALMANAIELRVPLREKFPFLNSGLSRKNKNNRYVFEMISGINDRENIFLKMETADLQWMDNIKTNELLSFMIKTILHRKEISQWIDSYYLQFNTFAALGDFFVSGVGDHSLNQVETLLERFNSGDVLYIAGRDKIAGAWNCISAPLFSQSQLNWKNQLNPNSLGTRLTPRIEEKLLEERGIIIQKDLFIEASCGKSHTLIL